MDELLFSIILWGVVVGGGSLFVIFCFVMAGKDYKKYKAQQKENNRNQEPAPVDTEYTTIMKKATVIEMHCGIKTIGIRTPKTIKEFMIVFQTEQGEVLKFMIPEEMYDGFEKGQTGQLSIVDGGLYGFVLEESDTAS